MAFCLVRHIQALIRPEIRLVVMSATLDAKPIATAISAQVFACDGRLFPVSVKYASMTARGLAYVVRAVGRKIAKAHRAKQTPHGKQTVKKLMAHGTSTNSLELSGDTKLFDRVARKWNVDYAFYQTEPGKYLLFFKSGQADAMTACFSEYSRKVLDKAKSRQPTIPEQMKQAEQQLAKEKPPKEHIKEVSHDR